MSDQRELAAEIVRLETFRNTQELFFAGTGQGTMYKDTTVNVELAEGISFSITRRYEAYESALRIAEFIKKDREETSARCQLAERVNSLQSELLAARKRIRELEPEPPDEDTDYD